MVDDVRALARLRLALNATAEATMAGAYDPRPQQSPRSPRPMSVDPWTPERKRHVPGPPQSAACPAQADADAARRPPDGVELRAAVLQLPPATPEQAADEAADRAAIAAEPLLPAPGTAARAEMDRRHAAIIAGLLAAFDSGKSDSRWPAR